MGIKRFIKEGVRDLKKGGGKYAFQHGLQRLCGIDERIQSLEFFLNLIHSPSELPATSDKDLRILQECDALMLQLFHQFCVRHGLSYWLDFGTLIGAVRHSGFIPWDDDQDVAMPRLDYNKALPLLKADFEPYGFTVTEAKTAWKIDFSYQHEKTGLWLDIFPVDEFYTNKSKYEIGEEERASLSRKYHKIWVKQHKTKDSIYFENLRKNIFESHFEQIGKNRILYHGQEFAYPRPYFNENDEVFPLREISYEGMIFYAPNNVFEYLKEIYGPNFMQFPKGGMLHHDFGRGKLSTWAKRNGVDMNEIKSYLIQLLNNYTSDNE